MSGSAVLRHDRGDSGPPCLPSRPKLSNAAGRSGAALSGSRRGRHDGLAPRTAPRSEPWHCWGRNGRNTATTVSTAIPTERPVISGPRDAVTFEFDQHIRTLRRASVPAGLGGALVNFRSRRSSSGPSKAATVRPNRCSKRAAVRAYLPQILGRPVSDEQIGQHLEHVVRADLASHHDRQALPRVLVQHCQQLQRTPVVRPRGHEVVRPRRGPDTAASAGCTIRR